MTGWVLLAVLIGATALLTPFLGKYMFSVFGEGPSYGDRLFGPFERQVYRVTGVDPDSEQHWTRYVLSLLAFSAASLAVLYAILRLQGVLPSTPPVCPP